MNKKIIYILTIIILIIAGIFAATKITEKDRAKPVVASTMNNTNKVNDENVITENNTVELEGNEVENNVVSGTTELAPEEQAKQIAKDNWGEDATVYFSYDGKDENGRYIICVREQSSTKALYWYYVDVETGTFDIK